MEKRKIIFGTYDTALEGAWTVSGLELTSPDFQTNLVDIPGRDGPLDLSAALTGEPRYLSRTLNVTLETSDGGRPAREAQIRKIVNTLDGYQKHVWLPDDPDHYLVGRLRVVRNYNDLAHASVSVSAVCDPWLFSNEEKVYTLTAKAEAQVETIINTGRRTATPVIEVTDGDVNLVYGVNSWTLTPGTYQLPEITLTPGEHELTYSGAGAIRVSFREAVLL